MTTIGIIGAGAWGTALAQSFAREPGRKALLWARNPDLAAAINADHANPTYLPHIPLHHDLRATHDMAAACAADVIVLAVPAQHVRDILTQAAAHITPGTPVVNCAKGIEIATGKMMSQVAAEAAPEALHATLSGPNFAHEIARGLPAAATIACADAPRIIPVRDALASKALRLYETGDVIGVQVGGAVKNVIAIVCGIVAARNMGENARAAVVTRGLNEMARLSQAMGGRRETLLGLSGVGDLILTCSSMQSRNFSLGHALGSGKNLDDILNDRNGVTEGVPTAAALVTLAARHTVDMPIVTALNDCLSGRMDIDTAIHSLMARPLQAEFE